MPGILGKVPGYLMDPLGPLKVRWSYFPQALPWLLRFVTSTRLAQIESTADALIGLLSRVSDLFQLRRRVIDLACDLDAVFVRGSEK